MNTKPDRFALKPDRWYGMITYDMITFLCSRFQIFRGNTNAYNHAAIQRVDSNIKARAVRFIPLDSVVQACMRIQICGKCK